MSKLYEKLPDLESQLAIAKEESDQLSKRIREYNEKSNWIKEDLDTIKVTISPVSLHNKFHPREGPIKCQDSVLHKFR